MSGVLGDGIAEGTPKAKPAARPGGLARLFAHPLSATALLFLLLPVLTQPVGIDVATEIALLALYAIAFNLLLGYTGVVSFGHSLFFGVGAYGVGLIQIHLVPSTSVALILSVIAAASSALLVGALIIRRRGVYFALLTLAFTQMCFTIAFRWNAVTGGEMGLQGIVRHDIGPFAWAIEDPYAFYAFTAVLSFAGIAFVWALLATPFGKVLQGIRENEKRMRLLGFDTPACKLVAFVLSGALSGLAGALQALLFHSVFAYVFDWRFAGVVLIMTVLGGTRYFLGPVLGALIYVFLQHYLSSFTSHWMIVLGLVFVLSIVFLPDGAASLLRIVQERFGSAGRSRGEAPFARPQSPVHEHASQAKAGALEITGLTMRFGAVVVADDISLRVQPGQLFGVLGPNGAGKTTLFNIVSGLLHENAGQVRIGDVDLKGKSDFERARLGLSRSCQIVSAFALLTVFENVRLAVQAHDESGKAVFARARRLERVNGRAWAILDELGLAGKAALFVEQLSHGDQRLVELGITLASDPSVLLLDEPLAGLAERERNLVAGIVRGLAPKHTVVLVEHDVDRVLAICDHVAVLHHGKLVASADPDSIARDPEVRRIYLGSDMGGIARDRETLEQGPVALSAHDLSAAYGKSRVLHGVSLEVRRGEIVGLLGRNGVGKTTTVMSIAGALRATGGSVVLLGKTITAWTPDRINRAGIGVVPQGRRVFPNLTVAENLRVAKVPGATGRWTEDRVYEFFPRFRERREQQGRYLSGGEQQLLAIARALMGPLEVLILDEPMEGLSPAMVSTVASTIAKLRDENLTILLVEQAANVALQLVDRVYVMNNGRIVHHGPAHELRADVDLQQRLLGVHVQ